jgi:hypothetical protein
MKTTTFEVTITVRGNPDVAYTRLSELLNQAEDVVIYTPETYQDEEGEDRDTAELVK